MDKRVSQIWSLNKHDVEVPKMYKKHTFSVVTPLTEGVHGVATMSDDV